MNDQKNINPTQEEMDSFNARWQRKTEQLFEPIPTSEKTQEYWKMVNSLPDHPVKKVYKIEEAKKLFWKYLVSVIGKEEIEVYNVILKDSDYSDACRLLIDLIFNFENEKLKGKGGLYLWSDPGLGKTTLLRAAAQVAHVAFGSIHKPGMILFSTMIKDISKKIKGEEVDLTYMNESHLFLDDLTEKINQVSHYGDYKFSMNEIIQNRYELWKSKGLMTFISSNIVACGNEPGTLFSYLDKRSIDRFNEMYYVCEMYGESKRGAKSAL